MNNSKKRIGIIGSGNWGSTIGKIIGNNVGHLVGYDSKVTMWVHEEIVDGRKLTDIINEDHVNQKYLPGIELPPNVFATPDVLTATKNADLLIFVLPHQFLAGVLATMKGHVKPGAYGITLIKGLQTSEKAGVFLISDMIRDELGIFCAALMGANLAGEVSRENFCEATLGCRDAKLGKELKQLFQTDYFRIVVTSDEVGVELCGALKNVVAMGAGFAEGLGCGENTKAAVIRLGFKEMIKFIFAYFGHRGVCSDTFTESCGIADMITTCYGGRNRQIAVAFVQTGKSISQLEEELLNGQSAQGPLTAKEVNHVLKSHNEESAYPLFTAVHNICVDKLEPTKMIDCVRNHPEHS